MGDKIRVGILCGGKSGEHEISLISARSIVEAIDHDRYEVVLIGIDKTGAWSYLNTDNFLINPDDPRRISLNDARLRLAVIPGHSGELSVSLSGSPATGPVDVVFPVLHGPFGEDGTVQGLLKLADIPFVGAGVLGSAAGMDKEIMKRLLRDHGLPIGDFLTLRRADPGEFSFESARERLGLPLFVKPANLGSSVGISKVYDRKQFENAVNLAFQFDHKVLIEEFIEGRENECAVLGNDNPLASVCGEIKPTHDFYSYDAKYLDENGAILEIPASLDDDTAGRIQDLAVKTFKAICCEGMGRVDFFLKPDNEVIINEINTIPGFTKISMYPRLWEASGISYKNLISRLIDLALERYENDRKLKTSYT